MDLMLEMCETVSFPTPNDCVKNQLSYLGNLVNDAAVGLLPLRLEDRILIKNSKYERGNKLQPQWVPCP